MAYKAPAPAEGKYKCVENKKVLKITSSSTYKWGKRDGTWSYNKKKSRVKFRTGPLDRFYGRHVVDVFTSIDLYLKDGDKFKAVCVYQSGEEPTI